MKKILLFTTVCVTSITLFSGCSAQVNVQNNSTLATFDGGDISQQESYDRLISTAKYDENFVLIKQMLATVDYDLLDSKYHGRFDDKTIADKLKAGEKTAGSKDVLYKQLAETTNLIVTDEASATKAERYLQYIQTYITEEYVKETDVTEAYNQQYGEKLKLKVLIGKDKAQMTELANEINNGKYKIDDIINEFTKASKADQTIENIKFDGKYDVAGEDVTSGFPKSSGVFTDEDEKKIFDAANINKALAPIEQKNAQTSTYLLVYPYELVAATQKLDDTLKTTLRGQIAQQKMGTAKDLEIALREYRVANGFEIKDPKLKEAFEAYEAYVDTPEQQSQY